MADLPEQGVPEMVMMRFLKELPRTIACISDWYVKLILVVKAIDMALDMALR